MKTLYSKDNKGDLRVWSIYTEGSEVVVKHGKLGGKVQEKRYTAEGKSAGRSNSTTPEQQAVLEADAKYVKQLKSGYFIEKEDALDFQEFTPMKAFGYKDFAHKITYPCLGQKKLDGFRLMIDKNGQAWSKQGEPIELPTHWVGVKEFAINCGGLDGECYAGLKHKEGLSLQKIISAFRKPNEDTPKLQYWVYDIPNDSTMLERHKTMNYLADSKPTSVVLVNGVALRDENDADQYFEAKISQGYEGVVYRNLDANYEFGKRSYNLIKRKSRQTTEAVVQSVEKDRNGWGILQCKTFEGIEFKCQMRVDAAEKNYRLYENALEIIGKTIEVEFEDYSDDGVPCKCCAIGLREVDKYGRPVL